MKRLVLLLTALVLISVPSRAQDKKPVKSTLTQATVFFEGAELTHAASATLTAGENEISIEGLSPQIDVNSLKISTTGNVVVAAHEFSVDFLTEAKALSPRLKMLDDSIKLCSAQIEKIDSEIYINSNLTSYLESGIEHNITGVETTGMEDLKKNMDYYRAKSMELRTEQVELTRRRQDVYLVLSRLQAQFSQESVKGNKTSGVLRLNLSAPRAGKCDFTVSYYTPSAGWAPYYDINIASTDQPITIYSKSKVRQTTGLDWEKVKLTLSTATPTSGKVAPLFSTWFLQEMRAQQREYKQAPMAMQNSYSYDMIEESVVVGYASDKMRVRGTSASSASAEPLYVIDGVVATAADVASLNASSIASMEVLKDASATSLYGSRGANGVIVVTTKSGMDDYVAVAENELNVTYDIDMPYNIPGNGKSQSIDLQTRTANAEYKYYCAPKLDAETYLLAEIADWSGLGLLSGPANITYAGTYLGETMLDASSTREKLTLTLGTDTRVSVKREKMTDFSTTRAIGSDTQQTFTYQLTVRNNQSKAIRMTLKDQYPISTMKNVQVTLNTKETTPWTANIEELGVITWEEELAPGETKTYRISYTVKYPKNMRLNL